MTGYAFMAVAVVLMSTVGQLTERAYNSIPQFIETAVHLAGVGALQSTCLPEQDEETRLWLIGEAGAVYMMRLVGPGREGSYDGEFYSFHRESVESLHHRHTYDWNAVVRSLSNWETAGPSALAKGQRSFLSLVVERCDDGEFQSDTFWDMTNRSVEEQKSSTTMKAIILGLDSPMPVPEFVIPDE